jgi:dimethylaniline monooxygenase (N-oxide forming)
VAVVGAGVAGLQAVRALKAQGLDVTAFEGARTVGGLWKANYAYVGVQVPKQLYEFQDYPMTNVAWGEYATGEQVQTYIESYADAFGLRDSIQFNTKVTNAQQMEDGKWTIQIEPKEGVAGTLDFDYLVMSTGLFSRGNKYIPSTPGREVFPGEIMHSLLIRLLTQVLQRISASWSLVTERVPLIVLLRHLGPAHPLTL